MYSKIYRFHFVDVQQDLTHVDVEVFGEISDTMTGTIMDVPASCSPQVAAMYLNKAVDFADNHVGANFEHADPSNGFEVKVTKWIIESIELLLLGEDADEER